MPVDGNGEDDIINSQSMVFEAKEDAHGEYSMTHQGRNQYQDYLNSGTGNSIK